MSTIDSEPAPSSDERAHDILYWAGSPQLYLQMVTELGWPVGDFVEWLTESLTAMLITTTST